MSAAVRSEAQATTEMRDDKTEGTCMFCPFAWLRRKAIFAFTWPRCQPAKQRRATLAAAAIPGRSYG
eukprot:2787490-Pleurochrysis_carterae.AAC.1